MLVRLENTKQMPFVEVGLRMSCMKNMQIQFAYQQERLEVFKGFIELHQRHV